MLICYCKIYLSVILFKYYKFVVKRTYILLLLLYSVVKHTFSVRRSFSNFVWKTYSKIMCQKDYIQKSLFEKYTTHLKILLKITIKSAIKKLSSRNLFSLLKAFGIITSILSARVSQCIKFSKKRDLQQNQTLWNMHLPRTI